MMTSAPLKCLAAAMIAWAAWACSPAPRVESQTSSSANQAAAKPAPAAVAERAAGQPTAAEARAAAALQRIEATLLETMDVAPVLSGSTEPLIQLLKRGPRVARSWQLAPELAASLPDNELLGYIISRANLSLRCGTALLAQIDLRTVTPEQLQKRDMPRAFLDGPPVEAGLQLAPDCATLVAKTEPVTLANTNDFNAAMSLLRRSKRGEFSPQALSQESTAQLRRNEQALDEQHGAQPQPEPDIAALLGVDPASVYSGPVLVFRVYVHLQANTERVVLLLPLSS